MKLKVAAVSAAIPIVLLSLLGLASEPETAGYGTQATVHRVDISVDLQTGAFTYSLDPVRAKRGDHVEWNCEQGNWSIHMIDKTPFASGKLSGPRAGPKRLTVRPDAAVGNYKYFVAVAIGDEMYTDDPEVIIGGD